MQREEVSFDKETSARIIMDCNCLWRKMEGPTEGTRVMWDGEETIRFDLYRSHYGFNQNLNGPGRRLGER